MKTKEECTAALDKLEGEIKVWMGAIKGDPSSQGHYRELALAVTRWEESVMWMRRAMDRKFA